MPIVFSVAYSDCIQMHKMLAAIGLFYFQQHGVRMTQHHVVQVFLESKKCAPMDGNCMMVTSMPSLGSSVFPILHNFF